MRRQVVAIVGLGVVLALTLSGAPAPAPALIDVTVHEGTSMSVAVSPDGRTLAIDLQGSIWTLPAAGGTAKRITDVFNDARQPAWSPDGKWIAFFAYRDGGYDIWAVAPDGSNQHKLTWGPFDDREPAWSHDGTRVAFSSDRGNPLGSDYNIWTLDVRSGELKQVTKNPADDYMPSWSPDDKEIAFASTREDGRRLGGQRRRPAPSARSRRATGRVDAPSWGPGGQIVYHVTGGASARAELALEIDGKTHHRQRECLRVPRLLGVADRVLLRLRRQDPQALGRRRRRRRRPSSSRRRCRSRAPQQLRPPQARLRLRPRRARSLGIVAPGALAGWQADRLRRARRHLRDAGRRQAGEHHQRHMRSTPIRRGRPTARSWSTPPTRAASSAAVDPRHEDRAQTASSPI